MACLNPGDVQSRHIMSEDGQAECLYSGVGNRGATVRHGASETGSFNS